MESQSAPRFPYRRRHRLTKAREYAAARAGGTRKARGTLLVTLLPTDHAEHRLGLQVGKRIGNAVVRGRTKRLIREAFRLLRADLPVPTRGSYDVVVSARGRPASLDECMRDLQAAVRAAWREASKRARRREDA